MRGPAGIMSSAINPMPFFPPIFTSRHRQGPGKKSWFSNRADKIRTNPVMKAGDRMCETDRRIRQMMAGSLRKENGRLVSRTQIMSGEHWYHIGISYGRVLDTYEGNYHPYEDRGEPVGRPQRRAFEFGVGIGRAQIEARNAAIAKDRALLESKVSSAKRPSKSKKLMAA